MTPRVLRILCTGTHGPAYYTIPYNTKPHYDIATGRRLWLFARANFRLCHVTAAAAGTTPDGPGRRRLCCPMVSFEVPGGPLPADASPLESRMVSAAHMMREKSLLFRLISPRWTKLVVITLLLTYQG